MALEVKGVAASPQRQAELPLRGKKCQGWRPDAWASHSCRPPEVPCLDLGRLGNSDEEDGDSYIPYSGSCPHTCQLGSSSDWRTSLQTPYAEHQHKTRPENLPSPTDRHKLKSCQYEANMKEEYKQYPQRIAEKKRPPLVSRHFNKAVISDPEQSTRLDVCKEAQGLLGGGTAPVHFRKRALHETKNGHNACRELIGFFFACDRSLTVYEFRQFGKNRTNALPFIQKGVYQHQHGQRKGKAYDLSDLYVRAQDCRRCGPFVGKIMYSGRRVLKRKYTKGANLTFRSVDHNLPESVKQNPVFTIRVISIDEAAMDFLKASFVEFKQQCSRQVVNDSKVFKKIQGHSEELWQNIFKFTESQNHKINKDFESLWLILDDSKSDKVDYGQFTRAIFGEMNEYRKAFVRKAYMKLDFNKTGSVPMVDVRKCYCAKKHPLILAGKAAEEEIKSSFLETLGESYNNPNEVSYSEFEDYYEGLSYGILYDDDFVDILKNSWEI